MDKLTYFSGSPFARMCRVMVIEWDLPVEPVEYAFPPGPDMFAINPLGQVPALIRGDGKTIFPTFLVLEALWKMAGRPSTYDADRDRQVLMTILQMTDAYVAACYQRWTGLGPVNRNAIGYDLAARHLDRVNSTLNWLETAGSVTPGVTLPGVALACLCLWADARDGLDWRRYPGLAIVVQDLDQRDSFAQTTPRVWRYE